MIQAQDSIRLGVLDLCKRAPDESAGTAIMNIVHAAHACELYGYRRYWLGEHHTSDAAICCPEILLPLIGARTTRIRIGLGGVLLGYQSARRAAELAFALEALFPTRVDFGICRGPGVASNNIAEELVSGNLSELTRESFRQKVRCLQAHLSRRLHIGADMWMAAAPINSAAPLLWILGASPDSIALAQECRCGLAVSLLREGRIVDKPDAALRSFPSEFHNAMDSLPLVALSAICMDTSARAENENRGLVDAGMLETNVVGDPEQCHAQIRMIARRTGARDFLISSWSTPLERRLRTFELLAGALVQA